VVTVACAKQKPPKRQNKVRCVKIHGRQAHADQFYLEGDAIAVSEMKARESFRDGSGAARWG
jgi:hypothetical protein